MENMKTIPFDGGNKIVLTKSTDESLTIQVDYKRNDGQNYGFTVPFKNEEKMNDYFDRDGGGVNLQKYFEHLIDTNAGNGIIAVDFDEEELTYATSDFIPKNNPFDLDGIPNNNIQDILISMLKKVEPITIEDYVEKFNGYINALKTAVEFINKTMSSTDLNYEELRKEGYNPEIMSMLNNISGFSEGIDFTFSNLENIIPDNSSKLKKQLEDVKIKIKKDYNFDKIDGHDFTNLMDK